MGWGGGTAILDTLIGAIDGFDITSKDLTVVSKVLDTLEDLDYDNVQECYYYNVYPWGEVLGYEEEED